MMDKPTIHQKLDACRPAQDDHLSEDLLDVAQALSTDRPLQQQFTQSQQLDAAISDAYRQVEVPTGLADQILAGLATESNQSHDVEHTPTEQAAEQVEIPAALGAPSHRRRWFAVGAGTLIAASLLVLATWGWDGSSTATLNELLLAAEETTDGLQASWQSSESAPHPQDIVRLLGRNQQIRGWQHVSTRWDGRAIAYDLSRQGPTRVVLLRLRVSTVSGKLAARLPETPRSSGGRAIGVCGGDGIVFILVVVDERGGAVRYKQIVPSVPFA